MWQLYLAPLPRPINLDVYKLFLLYYNKLFSRLSDIITQYLIIETHQLYTILITDLYSV